MSVVTQYAVWSPPTARPQQRQGQRGKSSHIDCSFFMVPTDGPLVRGGAYRLETAFFYPDSRSFWRFFFTDSLSNMVAQFRCFYRRQDSEYHTPGTRFRRAASFGQSVRERSSVIPHLGNNKSGTLRVHGLVQSRPQRQARNPTGSILTTSVPHKLGGPESTRHGNKPKWPERCKHK